MLISYRQHKYLPMGERLIDKCTPLGIKTEGCIDWQSFWQNSNELKGKVIDSEILQKINVINNYLVRSTVCG